MPVYVGALKEHGLVTVASALTNNSRLRFQVEAGTPSIQMLDSKGAMKGLISLENDSPVVRFPPSPLTETLPTETPSAAPDPTAKAGRLKPLKIERTP